MIALLAASPARQGTAGPFGFDPSTALGWSVPLILLGPLIALVMMLSGVRTRRVAANLATLGVLASALGAAMTAWARFKSSAPYTASYQWINIPIAFTGPEQFQGFGIDESIRLDRLAFVYLAALVLLALLVISWHRVAGRAEPGPVRFYSVCLLLFFGAAGVVVAPDLAELAGFWGFAAVGTYLLLAQRWGVEPAARGSRAALWLAFVPDACLLAGIGVLYSRYGQLTLEKLIPVLHVTPGWGYRSLTVAGALIAVAVAGRLGLFPFSAWITSAVDAPPAALGLTLGVWTLLPLYVLWRLLPVLQSAGPQAAVRFAGGLAVLGLAGPLLAFVGNDIRRVVVQATSGPSALAMLAIAVTATTPAAAVAWVTVASVPALAFARAAMPLAAGTIAAAMRTPDLGAMGEGLRRLPRTTWALLLASLVSGLGLAASAALLGRLPGSALGGRLPWIFAAGLLVSGAALARPGVAVASGPLRRRRAFEPDRVREAPGAAASSVLLLSVAGIGAIVLASFTPWLGFLYATTQAPDVVRTSVLWLAAVAGLALGAAAYAAWKERLLRGSAWLGTRALALWVLAAGLCERYVIVPPLRMVETLEGPALGRGEGGLGLSLQALGRDLRRLGPQAPLLPFLLILAAVVVIIAGLASPALAR